MSEWSVVGRTGVRALLPKVTLSFMTVLLWQGPDKKHVGVILFFDSGHIEFWRISLTRTNDFFYRNGCRGFLEKAEGSSSPNHG